MMSIEKFNASVQYDDYEGTTAADNKILMMFINTWKRSNKEIKMSLSWVFLYMHMI